MAGLGTPGYSGDGGPAFAAQLKAPADISPVPDGAILIADAGNGVIRRVSSTGIITTIAGAGPGAAAALPSISPVLATRVRLSNPQGVAAVRGGGFLVADTGDNMILKVSAAGYLVVVAGTGIAGYSGDGGPAVSARLNSPTRVLPTDDGGFLVLDLGNGFVRRVSAAGTISTVPGSATSADVGIHGGLFNPGGLAQDSRGNIYVINSRQVVRVAPSGVANAIAGTGECGNTGDGGLAVNATFAQPAGLAITAAGLLVVDINASVNGVVRRLNASSPTITNLAGGGDSGTGACIGAGGGPSGALWPIFYITAPRSARAFRAITVQYVTTRAAAVQTSLVRAGVRLRTVLRSARPGLNSATFQRGVAAGTYTMRITAAGDLDNNLADEGGILHLNKEFHAALRVGR